MPYLFLTHWARPALTALIVPGAAVPRAEWIAAAALSAGPGPESWAGADTELRRRIVRSCRALPAYGLARLIDERPYADPAGSADSYRRCRARLTADFRAERGGIARIAWPQEQQWPALRGLLALTAMASRETAGTALPADENPLDAFTRYSVRTLSAEDGAEAEGADELGHAP